jgi:YD repeat-containing protein
MVPPAGKVVPIGDAPEGIVVGSSGVGAVAVRNPDGIALFDAATGAVRQTIPTSGSARHLQLAGPDGAVLVPLEASNELFEVMLSDGQVLSTATGVGRQPHDAALTSGGTVVVTNEMGGGVVFVRDGGVVGSLPAGPIQPGGVAAVGKYAAVADVQGNGVWVYDGTTRQQVAQAPVGVKLTHAVGLSADLAAFADTDGGAVLIDHIDPQITQVAKVDAPGNPYGLAYDAQRRRLFVTLTASNVLRVIDLADPSRPRILGGVPTVQQPNSVAVDPRSGAVLVTGSHPDGNSSLQIISADLLPTS